MARFTATRRYSSRRDGQPYGPWPVGSEVVMSEEDAAWVNRDSPGTLAPVVEPEQEAEAEPEAPPVEEEPAPEPERAARPARDRQHRGGRNRTT